MAKEVMTGRLFDPGIIHETVQEFWTPGEDEEVKDVTGEGEEEDEEMTIFFV